MSEEKKKEIKYCVYCGSDVGKSETYCPSCGKLIIKLKEGRISLPTREIKKPISIKKAEISRKCPGCGSIINSTVLNQCPICNTELEKISEVKKAAIKKKPGLIFTNKKLELEQKFILKRDDWNLREGLNVFATCIYIYIISFFLIYFLLIFQGGTGTLDPTIQTFLISQIPELLFGIYPLYYIYSKKHSYKKLGFIKNSKEILTGILIGLIGTLSLILLDFLYSSLINSLADVGLDLFDVEAEIILQNQIIRNADFIWVLLLGVLMVLGTISLELVFRGVLHSALKQRFNNIIYVILLVALIYSILMVVLYPTPAFFLLNFLGFVIIGIIYEITNGNIYSAITANVIYSITLLVLIFF
ncbi:MAG: CPBP family glutamic-type intramembrane protease [Promethearchaeota archaeon]|jgi:membrane protease YdiL (CAAX protease family)/predicted RNA-binding Zn-ribbon protein involved in translation (DUF1610 family)